MLDEGQPAQPVEGVVERKTSIAAQLPGEEIRVVHLPARVQELDVMSRDRDAGLQRSPQLRAGDVHVDALLDLLFQLERLPAAAAVLQADVPELIGEDESQSGLAAFRIRQQRVEQRTADIHHAAADREDVGDGLVEDDQRVLERSRLEMGRQIIEELAKHALRGRRQGDGFLPLEDLLPSRLRVFEFVLRRQGEIAQRPERNVPGQTDFFLLQRVQRLLCSQEINARPHGGSEVFHRRRCGGCLAESRERTDGQQQASDGARHGSISIGIDPLYCRGSGATGQVVEPKGSVSV